jgi:hypothetical protein
LEIFTIFYLSSSVSSIYCFNYTFIFIKEGSPSCLSLMHVCVWHVEGKICKLWCNFWTDGLLLCPFSQVNSHCCVLFAWQVDEYQHGFVATYSLFCLVIPTAGHCILFGLHSCIFIIMCIIAGSSGLYCQKCGKGFGKYAISLLVVCMLIGWISLYIQWRWCHYVLSGILPLYVIGITNGLILTVHMVAENFSVCWYLFVIISMIAASFLLW